MLEVGFFGLISSKNADFADFELQGPEGNEPILIKLPIRYPYESAIPK